jgi:signal peptidase I
MQKKNAKKSFSEQIIESCFILIVIFAIRTVFFGLYQVPSGSMEVTMLVGESFVADKFTYWVREPRRGEIIAFNDPLYEYSKNKLVHLFEQYVWGPSNWTKRVIGVPGDVVEGRIENGVPQVLVNGQLLDEPYLNKYPLAHVWTEDPTKFREQIQYELSSVSRTSQLDSSVIDNIVLRKWISKTTLRSYDPNRGLYEQPFYRMDERRMIRQQDGSLVLVMPGTEIASRHHQMMADQPTADTVRRWNSSDVFYVELGPDEYWCMGDNRLGSKDCRYFGPIKKKYIHARVRFRLFSVDTLNDYIVLDFLQHPIDIFTRIRWRRFFQFIW